jgi:hippurate hydrolase
MQASEIPTALIEDLVDLRRDIHAHPEMAFEERRTSDRIAARLSEWGIAFDRGIAKTGIVATIRSGESNRAIALRCDMDALPIVERSGRSYASTHEGVMHACGHDGHTTMLLGAARCLSQDRHFNGTVYLVFQPAEENEGGGRVMVDQGLFERYPVEAVYGMHNWPGLEVGAFAVHTGAAMAAVDLFEIELLGNGAHAAMPHLGDDPIVVAGQLITSIQTVVSRAVDPAESVVLTITQVHAGNNRNVVQPTAMLQGTCRYFNPAMSHVVEQRMRRLIEGACAGHGLTSTFRYERKCPAVINDAAPARTAASAAADVVGASNVRTDLPPSMGCEDFAHMLSVKQGCYVWIGNGPGDGGRQLHSNRFDFNDDILRIGVSYWVALVRRCLPTTLAPVPAV